MILFMQDVKLNYKKNISCIHVEGRIGYVLVKFDDMNTTI